MIKNIQLILQKCHKLFYISSTFFVKSIVLYDTIHNYYFGCRFLLGYGSLRCILYHRCYKKFVSSVSSIRGWKWLWLCLLCIVKDEKKSSRKNRIFYSQKILRYITTGVCMVMNDNTHSIVVQMCVSLNDPIRMVYCRRRRIQITHFSLSTPNTLYVLYYTKALARVCPHISFQNFLYFCKFTTRSVLIGTFDWVVETF